MDNEKFTATLSEIQEKVGKEQSATIADSIGTLMTIQKQVNTEIENRDKTIQELEASKEKLIAANANLLQQIPRESERDYDREERYEEKKPFDFRTAFEHGRLKR